MPTGHMHRRSFSFQKHNESFISWKSERQEVDGGGQCDGDCPCGGVMMITQWYGCASRVGPIKPLIEGFPIQKKEIISFIFPWDVVVFYIT